MKEHEFWSNVDIQDTDGCWLWTRATIPAGYGRVRFRSSYGYAHRVSYELTFGPIPDGLHVCHRCDNPACVNPSHLFLGTAKENMRDRDSKGRGVPSFRKGELRPQSKLNESDVRMLLQLKGKQSNREIAQIFGVSESNVSHILNGRSWSHITGIRPKTGEPRHEGCVASYLADNGYLVADPARDLFNAWEGRDL